VTNPGDDIDGKLFIFKKCADVIKYYHLICSIPDDVVLKSDVIQVVLALSVVLGVLFMSVMPLNRSLVVILVLLFIRSMRW